jgi:glycosyltransferase involved in cell wall biosynthesis
MILAYDCIPLQAPLSGIGRYTHSLGQALAQVRPDWRWRYLHSGRFHASLPAEPIPQDGPTADGNVRALVRQLSAARRLGRWFRERRVDWSHPTDPFDLYIEPNFVPLAQVRARTVISVIHDLSFRHEPRWHPVERLEWLERAFDSIAERSDRILVDSEFTRREALASGIAADQLELVHPGCDAARFRPILPDDAASERARHRLPARFVISVGTFEPRKNLHRLLDAWLLLDPALRREAGLVLVGGRGWNDGGLARRVAGLTSEGVHRLHTVVDGDLVRLLNLAEALVYPSLYEGFGLPPLEAMACGCPVVVSRAASLPEVCGDAAVYFDPLDPADIAQAISKQLLGRGREGGHVEQGLLRAAQFTWSAAAERVAALAEAVTSDGTPRRVGDAVSPRPRQRAARRGPRR